MDQGNVYNRINFNVPIGFASATGGPVQAGAMGAPYINYADSQDFTMLSSTQINGFMCPSTPRTSTMLFEQDVGNWGPDGVNINYFSVGSPLDYVVTGGVRKAPYNAYKAVANINDGHGILYDSNLSPTIAMITDGTSNTTLLTEHAGMPDLWHKNKMVEAGSGFGPSASEDHYGGAWTDWNMGEVWVRGSDFAGNDTDGLCVINCTNKINRNWYSFHQGGVHTLMADSSVRFISENISVVTFCELVTARSGHPVDNF